MHIFAKNFEILRPKFIKKTILFFFFFSFVNFSFAVPLAKSVCKPDLVVVGAGGAGLAAAIQATREGIKTIVLEKAANVGGNTQYSAGGINAAGTIYQKRQDIKDSVKLFYQDTMQGGKYLGNPKLVKELAQNSTSTFNWLVKMGADLSVVSRMGGSSVSRTHRPKTGLPVGVELIKILVKTVHKLNIDIRTDSKVIKLLTNGNKVIGVIVKPTNKPSYRIYSKAVILATGGFGANNKMVAHYRPDLQGLGTTNAPTITGDGIKLVVPLDAALVDMKQIQLHPTVSVSKETAQKHILLTETLRGLGAILVNKNGRRFVNEMQTRDIVSQAEINQPNHMAFLIFDQQVAKKFALATKFYLSKKVLYKASNLKQLANIIGLNPATLIKTIKQYNKYVSTNKDLAYHRTYMPIQLTQPPFFGGAVAPAIHYCMGGLKINTKTQVINNSGKPIIGLYAAGEITGGIQGGNRLGGNSLTDIFTFGRIAAINAGKFIRKHP